VIVEYTDAHREKCGVDPICRVLTEQAGVQIAPSTYYAAKLQGPVSAADLDDAYGANTLVDLWLANRRVYGVRILWHDPYDTLTFLTGIL
jgi:putative transposase